MPRRNGSSKPMVRIVIAHGRDLVRAGLRTVLESVPDWQVAGMVASGPAAIELTRRLSPDLAIVDLDLPGMDGLAAIAGIREVSPRTLAIVFGRHDDLELAERAQAAGARGILTDTTSAVDTITEVRSALRRVVGVTPAPRRAPPQLTPRELDVISLIASGCSTAVTGRTLGISAKTVERHRYNIMRKMDLDSIVEVVHYAVREGIIRL